MTLQLQARSQPLFENFIQFYVAIITVKHMGCHILNAVALYFILPQKHCNSDMMMDFTDRNMQLYLNKDKWFYLTDT
jgi:hypothetical protein